MVTNPQGNKFIEIINMNTNKRFEIVYNENEDIKTIGNLKKRIENILGNRNREFQIYDIDDYKAKNFLNNNSEVGNRH